MQTTTGTPSASAIARCSFDMPMSPAFAPTMRITQEGAPEVRPYNVVFKYRSCPAKSGKCLNNGNSSQFDVNLPMKDTILAACSDIASHPSFSLRIVSGSFKAAVFGRMGSPDGANPRICEIR